MNRQRGLRNALLGVTGCFVLSVCLWLLSIAWDPRVPQGEEVPKEGEARIEGPRQGIPVPGAAQERAAVDAPSAREPLVGDEQDVSIILERDPDRIGAVVCWFLQDAEGHIVRRGASTRNGDVTKSKLLAGDYSLHWEGDAWHGGEQLVQVEPCSNACQTVVVKVSGTPWERALCVSVVTCDGEKCAGASVRLLSDEDDKVVASEKANAFGVASFRRSETVEANRVTASFGEFHGVAVIRRDVWRETPVAHVSVVLGEPECIRIELSGEQELCEMVTEAGLSLVPKSVYLQASGGGRCWMGEKVDGGFRWPKLPIGVYTVRLWGEGVCESWEEMKLCDKFLALSPTVDVGSQGMNTAHSIAVQRLHTIEIVGARESDGFVELHDIDRDYGYRCKELEGHLIERRQQQEYLRSRNVHRASLSGGRARLSVPRGEYWLICRPKGFETTIRRMQIVGDCEYVVPMSTAGTARIQGCAGGVLCIERVGAAGKRCLQLPDAGDVLVTGLAEGLWRCGLDDFSSMGGWLQVSSGETVAYDLAERQSEDAIAIDLGMLGAGHVRRGIPGVGRLVEVGPTGIVSVPKNWMGRTLTYENRELQLMMCLSEGESFSSSLAKSGLLGRSQSVSVDCENGAVLVLGRPGIPGSCIQGIKASAPVENGIAAFDWLLDADYGAKLLHQGRLRAEGHCMVGKEGVRLVMESRGDCRLAVTTVEGALVGCHVELKNHEHGYSAWSDGNGQVWLEGVAEGRYMVAARIGQGDEEKMGEVSLSLVDGVMEGVVLLR